ncbi:MAG: hypothetical protein AAGI68_04960 [Planctomycetota bacterium]
MDLKHIGWRMGWLRARPWVWRYQVLSGLLDADRALSLCSEGVSRMPGLLGIYTRQAFYRAVCRADEHGEGGRVGVDVHFGFMSVLSKPAAAFGDRAYIGRFCTVGLVDMGQDAKLADGVQVLSGAHQHGDAPRYERVVIGPRAWIGAGAVVMADVGADAVVAAGAVVRTPVAAGQRVAGVPARVISRGGGWGSRLGDRAKATSSVVFDEALINQRREDGDGCEKDGGERQAA